MHRKIGAGLLALCLLTVPGCGRHYASQHSMPTATAKPHRTDLLGNPITTEYAVGTFLRENGEAFFADIDGRTEGYILSDRAKKDIASLGILEGTRIIINFTTLETGERQADSLEKILAE